MIASPKASLQAVHASVDENPTPFHFSRILLQIPWEIYRAWERVFLLLCHCLLQIQISSKNLGHFIPDASQQVEIQLT